MKAKRSKEHVTLQMTHQQYDFLNAVLAKAISSRLLLGRVNQDRLATLRLRIANAVTRADRNPDGNKVMS